MLCEGKGREGGHVMVKLQGHAGRGGRGTMLWILMPSKVLSPISSHSIFGSVLVQFSYFISLPIQSKHELLDHELN